MTLDRFESQFKDRELIGSGGFGDVFKAWDHANKRYVALKIARVRHDLAQYSLMKEVELVNRLPAHPNIARYDACYRFNMGVAGDIDVAILKYYGHGNLEQFLQKNTLGERDIQTIVAGILKGVHFLHLNSSIHRDLKSQNILLEFEDGVWTPKITDFGLGRLLEGDNTESIPKALTYAYAAPEQIQNERIYKNVDIWAAGVIIYRIVAGELPFKNSSGKDGHSTQSQIELSRKIVTLELPQKLYSLPEPYQSIIKRCLVLNPKERAQSAQELLDLLDGIQPLRQQPYPSDDEKTYILTPYANKPFDSEVKPTIAEEATVPLTQFETPVASYVPPSSIGYTPPQDYTPPKDHYTQVIGEHKQPAPTPPPQPQVSVGEPRNKFNWLWVLVPVLLVAIGLGVYWFVTKQPDKPKTEGRTSPIVKRLKTPQQLEDENEAAKSDQSRLELLAKDIQEYIKLSPDTYKPVYLLVKNRVYAGQYDEATLQMKKAVQLAITKKHSQSLLADIKNDRLWDAWSRSGTIRKTVTNALTSGDSSLLDGI